MKKLVLLVFIVVSFRLFSQEYSLNKNEIEGLLLMREEEKLARDVYSALYDIWNIKIFDNIAQSEETHMNRVKSLLDMYNIEDPVKNDVSGKFINKELQEVYNHFIQEGKKSLYDALFIGATIEDLDIYDLENLMEETHNEEILFVYSNLRDGSINHINAFNRQLKKYGEEYTAQYISDSYLYDILNK